MFLWPTPLPSYSHGCFDVYVLQARDIRAMKSEFICSTEVIGALSSKLDSAEGRRVMGQHTEEISRLQAVNVTRDELAEQLKW